ARGALKTTKRLRARRTTLPLSPDRAGNDDGPRPSSERGPRVRWNARTLRGAAAGVPHLEHLLADLLRDGLDLLHGLAHARRRRLVALDGLVHVVTDGFDRLAELLVVLGHWVNPVRDGRPPGGPGPPKGPLETTFRPPDQAF